MWMPLMSQLILHRFGLNFNMMEDHALNDYRFGMNFDMIEDPSIDASHLKHGTTRLYTLVSPKKCMDPLASKNMNMAKKLHQKEICTWLDLWHTQKAQWKEWHKVSQSRKSQWKEWHAREVLPLQATVQHFQAH